ncbi:MAG: PD40 domain-containing protein [Acidobacteria bacterium]|nr:PD40 domain-containing protein [Acidobacteriota bacterium]
MAEKAGAGVPTVQAEDRLDSWKEIAAYLNRDVTTVQRWEKREGMPVHRHQHDRIGSVYASRAELEAWARSRARRDDNEPIDVSRPAAENRERGVLRWWIAGAALAIVLAGSLLWVQRTEYFWRNPLSDAHFQRVTDFDSFAQGATISGDGRLIAFLSDREGQTDIWLTQVGSGQFHNLTHGKIPQHANPDIRPLSFTPDNSLLTFWTRAEGHDQDISMWAIPTLGGEPRPYLEGAGEAAWSHDGSRLAYHTHAAGDPLYVSSGLPDQSGSPKSPILTAPAGWHSHFPIWSPDDTYIYFAHGLIPDKMNIWRIKSSGGRPEQITSQNGAERYPVLLDRRTLLYLAYDPEGSGPWLYGLDVQRRVPHRLSIGLDRYTSLSGSADGTRLALTLAAPKRTLWRSRIADSGIETTVPIAVPVTTNGGFSPRFGRDYFLYVAADGTRQGIWKVSGDASTELWNEMNIKIVGAPAISPDGRQIVFSFRQQQRSLLYTMQADGSAARVLTDSLDLAGAPTWSSDGKSILSAANDRGTPHLFRVPLDGGTPSVVLREYSTDPACAPDGSLVLYSGPDVGTTFTVKAMSSDATRSKFPPLTLTRGSRHVTFAEGGRKVLVLRGDIEHKDLWSVDLNTGSERQLTHFAADFNVRDFDVSPNGKELIFEREQQRSDVVLLELPRH